jgi:Cu/Zn superoxide dismutase
VPAGGRTANIEINADKGAAADAGTTTRTIRNATITEESDPVTGEKTVTVRQGDKTLTITGEGVNVEKEGKKVPALAAGGHYDPQATGKHGLPWGDGHLGDRPALYVAADGQAAYPVLAPRLKAADVHGRSLMVHAGADNHADHPAPLGGGGIRFACGVIP